MKKLLSTTAILGALALTAGSAEAANLQVNVGGFLDFQAGYTDDNRIKETGPAIGGVSVENANPLNFNTDTEIHFTVEGKADNGFEYGAVIELEADAGNTDLAQNGGLNADKAYLYGQGKWGRLEMGDNTDAAEALKVDASTFASATGGDNGDFYRYLPFTTASNTNVGAIPFAYVIRPELPVANGGAGSVAGVATGNISAGGVQNNGVDEDSTKITYYSPRIVGFQAGATFTPNTDATGFRSADEIGFKDVFTGGLNYTTQYDQFAIKLAATGEEGSPKGPQYTTVTEHSSTDLRAWNAGANVSFAGFTVGGSYGDLGQVITDANGLITPVDNAFYYDAGVGYAWGPFSASGTFFQSRTDTIGADHGGAGGAGTGGTNSFQNITVGADYKLAPGLVPYAEVSFFDAKGNGEDTTGQTAGNTPGDNGTIFILGTQLTF